MHIGKRLWSLVLFVFVSCIGGLLVAGLAVPVAGLVNVGGIAVAEGMDALPTELETPPQFEQSKLLLANGKVLAYFYEENRIYKPLDEISELMQRAQVAIEDNRFYEHGAIDLRGTMRALVSTSQGVTQGGSSITQQYVRLVLVETAVMHNDLEAKYLATENTLARKMRELRYAIAVEKKFSKQEILERYLNIAYYGEGAYGVESAARHYFGVSAAKLDLAQSAMLAGLVRDPLGTNPVKHPEIAIERRNNVLDRMLQLKLISFEEAQEAKAVAWDPKKVTQFRNGCYDSAYPFVCQYAKLSFLKSPELGASEADRNDLLERGGLTIKTHFDPTVQKTAESTIGKLIAPTDHVVSVIAAIEPGTGLIVAMAQSRPKMGDNGKAAGKYKWKGETYWNYAAGQSMGGAQGFQAGSTFKMFVAAAALDQGMGVNTTFNVPRTIDFKGKTFRGCGGSFVQEKSWRVTGSTGSRMGMYEAARRSVNGYFVQLEQGAGICESVKMARTLGLEVGNGEDLVEHTDNGSWPSFTLGTVDITPLSMVKAYATIAARGMRCDPIILSSIEAKDGSELPVPSANCKQVISEELANTVANVFKQSMYGTSSYARIPGIDMAGKTGTVDGNKAIWQVAITPNLAMAAVISYDADPTQKSFWEKRLKANTGIKNVRVKGKVLYSSSGPEAGGLLLKPVFRKAMEDRKKLKFPAPDQSILRGKTESVPSCSGRSLASCKQVLVSAGFLWYEQKVDSEQPKGAFVGISPSGKAPKNSAIALQISKGPKPLPVVTPPPAVVTPPSTPPPSSPPPP
ncbi:MAG: penicillin-binding protein [Propionibacteriaceae bacterium]|jgi:membrane peptidoglycan carboxypeptidase|nr:penicillin-binding protein [Propionibacteriaceae bacterium]